MLVDGIDGCLDAGVVVFLRALVLVYILLMMFSGVGVSRIACLFSMCDYVLSLACNKLLFYSYELLSKGIEVTVLLPSYIGPPRLFALIVVVVVVVVIVGAAVVAVAIEY